MGLNEKRTGIICLGAKKACCGNKIWEEKHPEVAAVLFELAEFHAQQDPTFRTTLSFTRLTAAEALKQLRDKGFPEEMLPSPRTMANILNRNGFRLRLVEKAKPLKKTRKQTLFSTISKKRTDNSLTKERPSE
ncbi:ISAzo13-like element transposase-related protein [Desulfosarcina ovata]|uniref:ISAzo13-like element transposase-related protein n=1 Tax=Desulfosarcina ovata TaxID=83564 RepID=UPI0012D367D1|nr:transposase [Desulfosarcina ovata]